MMETQPQIQNEQWIECVPNFSEGRDSNKINSIAEAIRSHNVRLLHIDSGFDANRTVFTLVGTPENIIEAIVSAFKTAKQLCNMERHLGTHPRIGLLDVCPFIPLRNISLVETAAYAVQLAERLAEEFDQTIYLYEHSAKSPERQNLANIRRGEYEGLQRKLSKEEWVPDLGSKTFLPRTGATILGARPFLIAYNVNLNTKSISVSKRIAEKIRASGYKKELRPGGLKEHVPGLLPELKAIGWYVKEYGCTQVSMNLINFNRTGMHEAFEACRHFAEEMGVEVSGSELIGLVPLKAITDAGRYYATRDHILDRSEPKLVEHAIQQLGLNNVKPFSPKDHIIDYQI